MNISPLPLSIYERLAYIYRHPDLRNPSSIEHLKALPVNIQSILHDFITGSWEFVFSKQDKIAPPPFKIGSISPLWTAQKVQQSIQKLVEATFKNFPETYRKSLQDQYNGYASFTPPSVNCSDTKEEESSQAAFVGEDTLTWLKIFTIYVGDWTLDILNELKSWRPSEIEWENRGKIRALQKIHYFLENRSCTSLDLSNCTLKELPPIFSYPFTERLRHLNLRNNFLTRLPEQIGSLQALESLRLESPIPAFLPLSLGHLHQLKVLQAEDASIYECALSLYHNVGTDGKIFQSFLPHFFQDAVCSWVAIARLGIVMHPKFPKESYCAGKERVKKRAHISSSPEMMARLILKINQNPVKHLQTIARINRILSLLKGSRGIVEKHFDVLVLSRKRVWKVISYEKEYNWDNLFRFVQTVTPNLRQKQEITAWLLEGVKEMHAKGIYHRNLRPDHVLIHENEMQQMQAAITGFSGSWIVNDPPEEKKFYRHFYDPDYASPEIAACHRKGALPSQLQLFLADSWSLGMILYYLWSDGRHPPEMPFDNGPVQEQYLIDGIETNPFPAPFDKPKEKKSIEFIIWQLLQFDLNKRLTAARAWREFQKISTLEKQE